VTVAQSQGQPFDGLRVAVVAEFLQGSTGRAIAEGVRLTGIPTTEIQVENHHLHYTSRSLRALGLLVQPLSKRSLEADVLAQVRSAQANAVIILKGTLIRPQLIEALREQGVYTAIYYPDVHFSHRGVDRATIAAVDLLCTTKSFHLDPIGALRAERPTVLVHHGYMPNIHRPTVPPLSDADQDVDIFYAGTPSPYKAELLGEVVKRFPDRRILIAGSGWEAYADAHGLGRYLHGGPIVGTFLAQFHERARISLAMHTGTTGREGWGDLVSTRTFEIPACRGFMLHPDNADLRSIFDVTTEVGAFTDTVSMLDRIEQYLTLPEQRIAMRDAAYARAVPAYSYYARAQEILSHIVHFRNRSV